MIYDLISYNGERELLDLRLNILNDVVDHFIVVEFRETFSGRKKELTFPKDFRYFTRFFKKLTFFAIPENEYLSPKYTDLADRSPNVPKGGPEHWKREFCQKESLKWTIAMIPEDSTVMIGDVDEIVEPAEYKKIPQGITKFKLRVYTYYLNNRSSEQFWGPIRARWGDIKNECLNHVRNARPEKNTEEDKGWHFTSLHHQIRQKLEDSYTSDSYASDMVMRALDDNVQARRDFLGRDFTYRLDEESWPRYLKENKEKYKHLLLCPKTS